MNSRKLKFSNELEDFNLRRYNLHIETSLAALNLNYRGKSILCKINIKNHSQIFPDIYEGFIKGFILNFANCKLQLLVEGKDFK